VAFALPVALLVWLAGGVAGQSVRAGTAAPEITGGPWIGSQPLTMAGLRGRVVLVEFWTYG
jgi:hypothetical protein